MWRNEGDGRQAKVRARLRAKLETQGVVVNLAQEEAADGRIDMGKTLMQQLLEAKESEVQAKLAAMKMRKENFQMLNEQQQMHHGEGSKALPAQYYFKQDAADNPRARANVHHAGSHYHMAASRQQSHGVKVQGVVARHSSQGDRMQAMRQKKREGKRNQQAARDVANGQTHSEQKRGAGATSNKRGGKSVNKKINQQMTGK